MSRSRNASSAEAGSAFTIFGKTRLWNMDLDATYRKQGLNFASFQRVKDGHGERFESFAGKFSVLKYIKGGKR